MSRLAVFRERLRATSTEVLLEARWRAVSGDLGDCPRTAEAQNSLLSLLDDVLAERGIGPTGGLTPDVDGAPVPDNWS